jgi:hypothetical protein
MRHKRSLDDYGGKKSANKSAVKYRDTAWCSFANSAMPKANTRWMRRANPAIPYLLKFNHLRQPKSLAWRVPLLMAGINGTKAQDSQIETLNQEFICLTAKIIGFLIVFHSGWRLRQRLSRPGPARDTYCFLWRKHWCDSPLANQNESVH